MFLAIEEAQSDGRSIAPSCTSPCDVLPCADHARRNRGQRAAPAQHRTLARHARMTDNGRTVNRTQKARTSVANVDYLIIGAGATALAFADSLLEETDATIAIVDRYGRPGGHWTRAYPFVRLHQPSAFYGVNSRVLGGQRRDTAGGNAGLNELASGAEVVAYFDQLLNQRFLPSGRVTYMPMCEYTEGGVIVSLASGARSTVQARRIVDAAYMNISVPSMRAPSYTVADGVRCVPLNALTTMERGAEAYVVVGAGKTGIDACLWLLGVGVDPAAIWWIMPRDSWYLDRRNIQPGADFFDSTVGAFADQLEASAQAQSVDDLFERLERSGSLLRLDTNVRPTMYRCATVTQAEVEELRRIPNIIRMGHVQSIAAGEISLDHGSVRVPADTLYIDCSADGLGARPAVPVFAGDRITLQAVRVCQPTFSAALIGHVEAAYSDEAEKNEICTPIPHPDAEIDWLHSTLQNTINSARWGRDRELTQWIATSRLNIDTGVGAGLTPDQLATLGRAGQNAPLAIDNLRRLLTGAGA